MKLNTGRFKVNSGKFRSIQVNSGVFRYVQVKQGKFR